MSSVISQESHLRQEDYTNEKCHVKKTTGVQTRKKEKKEQKRKAVYYTCIEQQFEPIHE